MTNPSPTSPKSPNPQRKRKSGTPHQSEPPRKKISKPMILYKPNINLFSDYKPNAIIRVYIDRQYILPTHYDRKIYGSDVYVDESDLIAVCQHMGWINLEDLCRRAQSLRGIIATVKIVPVPVDDKDTPAFTSSFRNKIRSRSWLKTDQENVNAYTVIKCQVIRDVLVGEHIPDDMLSAIGGISKLSKEQLEHQRFLPDVTVVYNLANEPVFKYTLRAVADEGFEPNQFTSYKMLSKVLFVETKTERYELSLDAATKKYRWARVTVPPLELDLNKVEKPLSGDSVEVVHNDLKWSEIVWGAESVKIRDEDFAIVNVQWANRTEAVSDLKLE